jgi:hypothetical protein
MDGPASTACRGGRAKSSAVGAPCRGKPGLTAGRAAGIPCGAPAAATHAGGLRRSLAGPVPGTNRLEGRTAIITGATGGMGRATALPFAHEGAAIMASGRDALTECYHGAGERPRVPRLRGARSS